MYLTIQLTSHLQIPSANYLASKWLALLESAEMGEKSPQKRTKKFQNFRTPEEFAVIYLKLKQRDQTLGILSKKMPLE